MVKLFHCTSTFTTTQEGSQIAGGPGEARSMAERGMRSYLNDDGYINGVVKELSNPSKWEHECH